MILFACRINKRVLDYRIVDVFAEQPLAGNPLAVVLDADSLSPATMQAIAGEFNLSETVFVCRPFGDAAAARLRIFTPQRELPFAGHPTLGAACVLADIGRAAQPGFVVEEGVGLVPVRVHRQPDRPSFAQLTAAQPPSRGPALPPAAEIGAMLRLAVGDVVADAPGPRVAVCGLPFALIPLRGTDALAAIDLDIAAWRRVFAGHAGLGLWLYAQTGDGSYRARMFAPGLGVHEDPATGSAGAAFAGALAAESAQSEGTLSWQVEQGVEMGRPSRLYLEADKRGGAVTAVRVGGYVAPFAEGRLRP